MSAYVLNKNEIETLTAGVAYALQISRKYSASYPLSDSTLDILGKYADDLHAIYRALYITNIKAVNGRYGEETKTLPKYTGIQSWSLDRPEIYKLKQVCGLFGCYMYQISEDPICGSPIFKAISDIYKLLCQIYVSETVSWTGE